MKQKLLLPVMISALALAACSKNSGEGQSLSSEKSEIPSELVNQTFCSVAVSEAAANFNETDCFKISSNGEYVSYVVERQLNGTGAAQVKTGAYLTSKWAFSKGLITITQPQLSDDGPLVYSKTLEVVKRTSPAAHGSVLELGLGSNEVTCVNVAFAAKPEVKELYCAINFMNLVNPTRAVSANPNSDGPSHVAPLTTAQMEAVRAVVATDARQRSAEVLQADLLREEQEAMRAHTSTVETKETPKETAPGASTPQTTDSSFFQNFSEFFN